VSACFFPLCLFVCLFENICICDEDIVIFCSCLVSCQVSVAIFLLYVRYILLSVAAVITVMHIDGNTQLGSAVKGAKYC